jgi:hypothetical protein
MKCIDQCIYRSHSVNDTACALRLRFFMPNASEVSRGKDAKRGRARECSASTPGHCIAFRGQEGNAQDVSLGVEPSLLFPMESGTSGRTAPSKSRFPWYSTYKNVIFAVHRLP